MDERSLLAPLVHFVHMGLIYLSARMSSSWRALPPRSTAPTVCAVCPVISHFHSWRREITLVSTHVSWSITNALESEHCKTDYFGSKKPIHDCRWPAEHWVLTSTRFIWVKQAPQLCRILLHLQPASVLMCTAWLSWYVQESYPLLLTSTLTTYLTPYATLVHQGKGTKYPR